MSNVGVWARKFLKKSKNTALKNGNVLPVKTAIYVSKWVTNLYCYYAMYVIEGSILTA